MYVAVYSCLVAAGFVARDRGGLVWLIGACAFLLWFMGWRFEVGCDFTGYYYRFVNVPVEFYLLDALDGHEPAFELLTVAIRIAELEYLWLNVAASAIILAGYFAFLRVHQNPLMILALLFPIMILQLSMSGIRQGIAVALVMVASVFFMRGWRILTGLCIVLAAQFHASAVILLPLAFLAGQRVSPTRLILGVILLAPVAAVLLADRLEVYEDRYINQIYGQVTSGGGVIRFVLILLPALFFVAFRVRLRAAYPAQYDILMLMTLFAFALIPVALYSPIILHRLNFYVMPFSIVSFVYLSQIIFVEGQRHIGRLLPPLVYGTYMIGWLSTSRHADLCYLPYQNYLFSAT